MNRGPTPPGLGSAGILGSPRASSGKNTFAHQRRGCLGLPGLEAGAPLWRGQARVCLSERTQLRMKGREGSGTLNQSRHNHASPIVVSAAWWAGVTSEFGPPNPGPAGTGPRSPGAGRCPAMTCWMDGGRTPERTLLPEAILSPSQGSPTVVKQLVH